MEIEGKCPRERSKLRRRDTIRRDMKARRKGREDWVSDASKRKGLSTRPTVLKRETAVKDDKDEKLNRITTMMSKPSVNRSSEAT